MKGIPELLKIAQKAQADLAQVQQELGSRIVEASVGGGMVIAKANGKLEIVSVEIKPEVIASGDAEMLQDLVIAAVNEALRRAQAVASEEMGKVAGALKIPGMFGQ
ncbi:YbaB/EbfC family nucleoid-associated protein [bacterium]|nr:YbaB/EbfC family nucleoid-associated protein [bacterium]